MALAPGDKCSMTGEIKERGFDISVGKQLLQGCPDRAGGYLRRPARCEHPRSEIYRLIFAPRELNIDGLGVIYAAVER